MKVQFVDLKPQYEEIKNEIDGAMRTVIENSWFIGGKPVKDFEQALTQSFGRKFACGVANGTTAISTTLRSLKISPGDEVITTVHTAFPTAEAIHQAGAKVVFCDIEETYTIYPSAVEAAITPRTRAIIAVHLYGLPAKLNALTAIAQKHRVPLIEDCAQAQGAAYRGKPVGTFGLAACLSFFPSKNLGTFGDGGAVVTDDPAVDKYVRMFTNHGRLEKYTHEIFGSNDRLDSLHAAILRERLRKLDEWNARRRVVAGWYEELLGGVEGIKLPRAIPEATPCWHLYVIRLANRDKLMEHLSAKGISTGLHYPIALHLQPAFREYGFKAGMFPVAEKIVEEIVSLPMYPHLTRQEVEYVCEHVRSFIGK